MCLTRRYAVIEAGILTIVILNKLRCHTHFWFSANQITWSKLLIQIHILNNKQCRSRSVGFFRSQLIWIYTVCKVRAYMGSAGPGLMRKALITTAADNIFIFFCSFCVCENRAYHFIWGRWFIWNAKSYFLWKIKKKKKYLECHLPQSCLVL